MKTRWSTEQTAPVVSTIRVFAERNKSWEQWVLLSSDRHFDNPLSNQQLQKKHLDQALTRDAPIIDFGDCFCAMQGRNDRRGGKSKVREENQHDDYFDSLIRSGVDFFSPYSSNMAVWGKGNHESAILKHNETDLTRRLVERLQGHGSPVLLGGYRGWVRFMLHAGTMQQSYNLYYTHGSGGSAPVTKGVIQTNRRASYVDADIICAGHIHEAWALELCRVGLTYGGDEAVKDQIHLCIPTYKEEFVLQDGGFHHEKGGGPKPLGAWWLRFYHESDDDRFKFDYVRAK